MATLTFDYSERLAVLGPLSSEPDPNGYDLCAQHAERLTVPRGWEVVRLDPGLVPAGPTGDDLLALADAVREAGRPAELESRPVRLAEGARRGHLRLVQGEE